MPHLVLENKYGTGIRELVPVAATQNCICVSYKGSVYDAHDRHEPDVVVYQPSVMAIVFMNRWDESGSTYSLLDCKPCVVEIYQTPIHVSEEE